jgi:arabinofuranan 3-O-arabinosyltransferase
MLTPVLVLSVARATLASKATNPGSPPARRWDGARETMRARLWPIGALFAAVALFVVLTSAGGAYVGDNRFEQFWNPARRLAKTFTIWDGTRGLGRVREDVWPGVTVPAAVFRALGASPTLAEHLWHATLLVVVATGVTSLLRVFRPRIGPEHLIAGFLAMLGPYSVTFLVPSNLYFHYAITPWLLLCFWRGVHGSRPWAWAAGFALLVFSAGNVDLPGLAYAVLPVGVAALYVLVVERSASWRRVLGWSAAATLLTLLVSAAVLYKVWFAAATLSQRLGDTESPATVHVASSWPESLRGLGFWLSYHRDQNGLSRPQGSPYFTNLPLILVTFAIPACALLVLAWSRWRPRLLFGALMLGSLVLMVGAYPVDHPSPYGRLRLSAYRTVPGLSALRTSYKAGAGLAIGVAVLLAIGVVELWQRARPTRPRAAWLVVPISVALVVGAALPALAGDLYDSSKRLRTIPGYWHQALGWLDSRPGNSRVLILPGTTKTGYRWGWVGDDFFDALLDRPHATSTSVPLSNPASANLLDTLDTLAPSADYVPGTLPAIARRLGFGYVVLRNDVDWKRVGVARPAAFDRLRRDSGLRRVATFGRRGENVTPRGAASATARRERALPPVEVYSLGAQSRQDVRVEPLTPPLAVSGDGEAWPELAQAGLLDPTRPIQYTGQLGGKQLRAAVDDASRVVITDTNRRRVSVIAGNAGADYSHTLASGQDLERPAKDLFGVAGSQSVATFGDAASISATGPSRAIGGFEPWRRPANAFDGNPSTAWLTGFFQDPIGRELVVRFRSPVVLSEVRVGVAQLFGRGRAVSRASLHFDSGPPVPIDLADGSAEVRFPPRRTGSVSVRIDEVSGPGPRAVGFSEVSFGRPDLVELVQVPDDVFRAGDRDLRLGRALERVPITYLFRRSEGSGPQLIEPVLRRRFRVAGTRSFAVTGTLRVDDQTPDVTLDGLLGGDRGAYASVRYQGRLAGTGRQVLDGSDSTGWVAPAVSPGATVTLRFPSQVVTRVDVAASVGRAFSSVRTVRVRVGAQVVDVPLSDNGCPAPLPETAQACVRRGTATVPPTEATSLSVEPLTVDLRGGAKIGVFGAWPLRITEVTVNGRPNGPDPARLQPPAGCFPFGVTVDSRQVPIRVLDSATKLATGRSVRFTTCEPVTLSGGWHRADTTVDGVIERLRLDSDEQSRVRQPQPRGKVRIERAGPTSMRVKIDASGPVRLILPQSFDPGWHATVDGKDLGRAQPFDTLNGWTVPGAGVSNVELQFEPQRGLDVAWAITAVGLVACGALIALARRRRA